MTCPRVGESVPVKFHNTDLRCCRLPLLDGTEAESPQSTLRVAMSYNILIRCGKASTIQWSEQISYKKIIHADGKNNTWRRLAGDGIGLGCALRL